MRGSPLAGLFCAMLSNRVSPKPAMLEPSDQFSLACNARRGEHRSSDGAWRVLGQVKVSAVREVKGGRVLVDTVVQGDLRAARFAPRAAGTRASYPPRPGLAPVTTAVVPRVLRVVGVRRSIRLLLLHTPNGARRAPARLRRSLPSMPAPRYPARAPRAAVCARHRQVRTRPFAGAPRAGRVRR